MLAKGSGGASIPAAGRAARRTTLRSIARATRMAHRQAALALASSVSADFAVRVAQGLGGGGDAAISERALTRSAAHVAVLKQRLWKSAVGSHLRIGPPLRGSPVAAGCEPRISPTSLTREETAPDPEGRQASRRAFKRFTEATKRARKTLLDRALNGGRIGGTRLKRPKFQGRALWRPRAQDLLEAGAFGDLQELQPATPEEAGLALRLVQKHGDAVLPADEANVILGLAPGSMEQTCSDIVSGRARSKLRHRVTGNLRGCVEAWREIGASESQIDTIMHGFEAPRVEGGRPEREVVPTHTHHPPSKTHHEWLDACILEYWATQNLSVYPPGWRPANASKLSVVPKSGFVAADPVLRDKLRLITDLSPWNPGIDRAMIRFRLDTLDRSRHLFNRGDWMLAYDILHAYHHVELRARERDITAFAWGLWPENTKPASGAPENPLSVEGRLVRFFRFNCLCFGGSASPWVFQGLMDVVLRHFRALGIRVLGYIDDFIFVVASKHDGILLDKLIRWTFKRLGLAVNIAKSTTEPSQRVTCLGVGVDTRLGVFFIPEKKAEKIRAACESLLERTASGAAVPVRDVASLTGKLMACHVAVGKMVFRKTRSLYRLVAAATSIEGDPEADPALTRRRLKTAWRCKTMVGKKARAELRFWAARIDSFPPSPIDPTEASALLSIGAPGSVTLASDTGAAGFGGVWLGPGTSEADITSGALSRRDAGESSTVRELVGAARTIQAFARRFSARMRTCHFFLDNQSAVLALSRGSSTGSVDEAAERVHQEAENAGVNVIGHWMRRSNAPIEVCDWVAAEARRSDFSLGEAAFRTIEKKLGAVDIDVMASPSSRKTFRYISRFLGSNAHDGANPIPDAFVHDWGTLGRVYCYPPWVVLERALAHARSTRAHGIFVVPYMPHSTWWHMVSPFVARPERYLLLNSAQARLRAPTDQGRSRAVDVKGPAGEPCRLCAFAFDWRTRIPKPAPKCTARGPK